MGTQEMVAEGLVTFVERTGDTGALASAVAILRRVADAFDDRFAAGDECLLALPALVVRPELRVEGILAVFPGTVVAAWSRGLLRKTTQRIVIARSRIADVELSGLPDSPVLRIVADQTHQFRLARGQANAAHVIRDLIGSDPVR